MSYSRLKICAAFHPESGTSQEWDKCHQLRNAIHHRNKTAKHTVTLGKEMSFNEGGIQSKSNYNPVRYNKSKPDKYGIDCLFLLKRPVGMISSITLMSIRENNQNIGIAEDLWKLPMTQKEVVNAIVSTRQFRSKGIPQVMHG